ncbi:MAG TPA: response regulator transcription factor [Bacteroidia bacterium]|nr:response regulator transcription factor [Bacteroidia bacterium]
MQKPHIFIVEDEENLANTIALNLKLENYEVLIARTGGDALKLFTANHQALQLVLLDVMLPDINGFKLCQEFRLIDPSVPVMFLTAKNQTAEKIEGLKLGADDYITKPFDLEELLLRISNLLKRTQKVSAGVFKFDNCEINFKTYEIIDVTGKKQTLSKREIGLLELLTTNENKVISRDEIINELWEPDENASSRTIDNYILNFRKFFENNSREPRHFHSIRGVGYKFIK